MPIYEYVCQSCETRYDKFIRSLMAEVKLECPNCGSAKGEKALSVFSTGNLSAGKGLNSGGADCGPVG